MLKRIGVDRLREGMFIKEFCGSWIDHPFWRSQFVVDDSKVLQQIRQSPVQEVWIDVSKGVDVLETPSSKEKERPASSADSESACHIEPKCGATHVCLEEEIERAAKICEKARSTVSSMFNEARMGKLADAERVVPLVEEISNSIVRNPDALISLARLKSKDDYTYLHSVAVCALMIALARQLGQDETQIREAGVAGLLHDIGKMGVPNEILNKRGKQTDIEFAQMRLHPEKGYRILIDARGVPDAALEVCLHHHEKMDGTGYPNRQHGDRISVLARMGAICDVYDAITSNRPYKAGWGPAESIQKMTEWCGSHFDKKMFQAFVKSVGIYPVGSLVRLASNRLGVVVGQSDKSLLMPKVNAFFSINAQTYIRPEFIDTSSQAAADKIVGMEDAAKWNLRRVDEFWNRSAT